MSEQQAEANNIVDQAVAEGGAYEVIRKRLLEQGKKLKQQTLSLNEARLTEFGSSEMAVAARVRVRTENNCVARDIVQVGELLLFGYNVYIGLKKETRIEDVFSLFRLVKGQDEAQYEMEQQPLTHSFLTDASFANDFAELYRYYKQTQLLELTVKHGKLLAGFQIGERIEDIRVFRWAISADGKQVEYIDNRGERDIQLPPAFDFEWRETTRDDAINGRHPHVNILDTVFVETINGDLTVKVEDNTDDGLGIYREEVEDKTQSLDDASIAYAKVGNLILLRILPYREQQSRFLIFNSLTQTVLRLDAVGESCVQLPEDQGIIFPGGYYLQTGEYKTYETETDGLKFRRRINSPNGEDILYVFYQPEHGIVGLFAYNVIEQSLQNPIYGHGHALSDEGTIVIFSAEIEPTRIHPMQIWHTPYQSQEFASKAPTNQSFFGRIGNAALVRGIADLYSVGRLIDEQAVSARLYEDLSQKAAKMLDAHYWLDDKQALEIDDSLKDIASTAELVIDEFEKVESIRQQSAKTMQEAEKNQAELLHSIQPDSWETAEEYVLALDKLRYQRGHLATIKDYRYINLQRIDELDLTLQQASEKLSEQTGAFLAGEDALQPYQQKIEDFNKQAEKAQTNAELTPVIDAIETTAKGLDLLSELMTTLKISDATIRTRIVDAISEVYSRLNQSKANARHKQKAMGSEEAIAQFSAQFKLFSQSITNALEMANTPERCDEQLSRLLVQLEELESQFSDFDQFLNDIMTKREEIYESFEKHKQQLLDTRQRKAQSLSDAAQRMLANIERRCQRFSKADELNTYFAADALVLKVRELVEKLRDLDNAVKADDIASRYKAIQEQALRSLRDQEDIYEEGGNVIKLGPRHKFSVNTQELDLTIIPRDGELNLHMTGTDYFERLDHPDLLALKDYWEMALESESTQVYRAEYLAYLILQAAEAHQENLDMTRLQAALNDEEALQQLIRDFAAPRYREGYEKGIHDHDCGLILKSLIPALQRAELLRYSPASRALASIFWANRELIPSLEDRYGSWQTRAQSAAQMQLSLTSHKATQLLTVEVEHTLKCFLKQYPIKFSELEIAQAATYLVAELSRERLEFISSKYAQQLNDELRRSLDESTWRNYQSTLEELQHRVDQRWQLTYAWLGALIEHKDLHQLKNYIAEAAALLNGGQRIDRRNSQADLELSIDKLMGEHSNIQQRRLNFSVDAFLQRLQHHQQVVIPGYHHYHQTRQAIMVEKRDALRLEEFKAKPLSSFVRNKLINDAYLPIIGDNLAKQMGTIGDNKRSDLMGLLMMISPPGYGKTTLMEYIANRLGLIFMKINCPSLGHDVLSLDPEQAPNATARQELHKLNLALEMGNNVMLYLDDIQHTHPEFLQKFISLCDGTRRIEGIWKGITKTYDMRGKKFCVVMAGNPYTESGELFKIPDMLANRADIYNLGDILGGMDEQFALSYIENSLTSNSVLAPLAVREMEDIYKMIDMAKGANIASTDLSHQYSGAELNEILAVLRKLFVVQELVLRVNQQYISSAAQDDNYRTEPAFKLQGSYRNMNKMSEKVSAVMNDQELMQMLSDHYQGEAQLLTTGAEHNLLKLAQLRGNSTGEEQQRWETIIDDFLRSKSMGGDDTDAASKVVSQLSYVTQHLKSIHKVLSANDTELAQPMASISKQLQALQDAISQKDIGVNIVNQPSAVVEESIQQLANIIETTFMPVVASMDKKIDLDLAIVRKVNDLSEDIKGLNQRIKTDGEP
ncbi:MAG: AAA family ATPase [Methyloprofundus sp.]|nr:AAA family ATPase [Methyloprofundus sp.]